MSNGSREHILSRLNASVHRTAAPVGQPLEIPGPIYDPQEKIDKLKTFMEAMRTEVHVISSHAWLNTTEEVLKQRTAKSLLYAPETDIGKALESRWESGADDLPRLIPYVKHIEQIKDEIFQVDAGITSAAGAIAETGALILWPTENEPRLMSIVPPIHIAVLKAETIHNSLAEVMQKDRWPDKMPTNIVLVSGPSKTADIEMTLAFGVHGPKELIVLILKD